MPPFHIEGGTRVLPDVHVIGYQKGWFLVDQGPSLKYEPVDLAPHWLKPYTGRGWVVSRMLTTEIQRNTLKQAPSEQSADVIDLPFRGADGIAVMPQMVRRILACLGDWVHVEFALPRGTIPRLETDAPAGAVRGWADLTCAAQLTTCDNGRPWSPPAPMPPE
jgi:hypothetical protein